MSPYITLVLWHCSVVTGAAATESAQCSDDFGSAHVSLLQESIHLATKRMSGSESTHHFQQNQNRSTGRIVQETAALKSGSTKEVKARGNQFVAVFVSGSLARYDPDSSAEHLVVPLLQAGYQVDYYISLNTAGIHSFKSHAKEFVMDPRFQGLSGGKLEQTIAQPLVDAGATVRKLVLSQEEGGHANLSKEEQVFVDGSSHFSSRLWWYSPRRKDARQNWLLRQKHLEMLWQDATDIEQKRDKQYALVINLIDDAVWARNFDLAAVLGSESLSETGLKAYSLLCGFGSTFHTYKDQITDTIFILERQAAVPLFTIYHLMLDPPANIPGCVDNSEKFYKWQIERYNVNMMKVPAGKLPVQRVGRVREHDKIHRCYHYKCLSPNVDWSNLFPAMPNCL